MNPSISNVRAGAKLLSALSDDDPIRGLIAEILAVVQVSSWRFARFAGPLPGDQFLEFPVYETAESGLENLRAELKLQRRQTPKGPRLSPMLMPASPPYVAGVTMVFADMRRDFGILNLQRAEDLGPFTSFEIQALAFALDASVDRLSGFALVPLAAPKLPFHAFGRPTMHVLDRDLNVVLTWVTPFAGSAVLSDIETGPCERLPDVIARAVKDLTSRWTNDESTLVAGAAQPISFLTVRAQPLSGPSGVFVGVLLERAARSNVFDVAAQAYRLSTREVETLVMLLQGSEIKEIARALHIVPATVRDHLKNMLAKTDSRNRAEMIGKLLNVSPEPADWRNFS